MTPFKTHSYLRLAASIAAAAAVSTAQADVVDDWNTMLLQTLAGIGQAATPTGNSRSLAIVSVSMYEAANSITQSYSSYLPTYQSYSGNVSAEAAAAQAARDSIVSLYGSYNITLGGQTNQNVTTYADALLNTHLNTYAADSAIRSASTALGAQSAAAVLAHRANDGFYAADTYVPQTVGTPGAWQPGTIVGAWGATTTGSFLQAQAGYMTPWGMTSGSQFRAAPPPALGSAEYAAAFNEVKSLGSLTSSTRTADQTNVAHHWVDGPGTESPPGHWNYIAQSVSAGIDFDDKTRLFALLNISNADAAIATWETKRYYDLWRPMQGIAQADIDGNAATLQDTSWGALLPTPSFPAYTSGHSAFSQSSADILELYFGTDNVAFTSTSHNGNLAVNQRDRSFTSFEAAADEAGMSRIYGGIHWQFDNEAGQQLGSAVAQNTFNTLLLPVPEPSGALLAMLSGLGLLMRRRRK
jgi:hypothetical protein